MKPFDFSAYEFNKKQDLISEDIERKKLIAGGAIVALAFAAIYGYLALKNPENKPNENNSNPGEPTIEQINEEPNNNQVDSLNAINNDSNKINDNKNIENIEITEGSDGRQIILDYNQELADIPQEKRNIINTQLYKITKSNLGHDFSSIIGTKVRPESIKIKHHEKDSLYVANFDVDVSVDPEHILTFNIETLYIKDKSKHPIGPLSTNIGCVPPEDRTMEFDCIDGMGYQGNKPSLDKIKNITPYETDHYVISYKDDKAGHISFNADIILHSYDTRPTGSETEEEKTAASVEKYKKEINKWIKSNGLNPDDYYIHYKIY
ncbi:hypothetical protein HGB24_00495 [Candidatus Saccharibacteria bacterium]|nr:hypothetical protein [Candidatus Saccharibacteria bacterium]